MVNYSLRFLKDVPDQLDWLHPSELEIYGSFRFEKKQKDWLLGRWTAKNLLKNCWFKGNQLEEIAVLPGTNKAPFVYLNEKLQTYQISISHSHGQAFSITTDNNMQVGCDLEKVEKRSPAFLKDYFSAVEHELYATFELIFSDFEYYTLCWSAKEALMKATKQGMSLHPLKIELSKLQFIDKGWNTLNINNLESNHSYFGFWKIQEEMVYVVLMENRVDLVEY